MRLLVHDWGFWTKDDVYKALYAEGIELFISYGLDGRSGKEEEQDKFKEEFEKRLHEREYDAVFSINFIPCIAEVCNRNDVMYIAWSYDSPSLGGTLEHRTYKTNRIFLFDSAELKRHQQSGIENLHFLNLATNVNRMNSVKLLPAQKEKYSSEISFVGQLYSRELQEIMQLLGPYESNFIQSIVDMQVREQTENIIGKLITDEIVDAITSEELIEKMSKYNKLYNVQEGVLRAGTLQLFLLHSATNRERLLMLSLLSKRHNVKLYSPDKHKVLNEVIHCGPVSYTDEMPLVFRCSKINLNITSKSIETGIPQRCLDIMGCHGFLLTNYQEDLFTEFEENKDLVIYRSIEEAVDKADFYLKHDGLRRKIAENGYKKVRDKFNYHVQLEKIWKITGLK